MRYHRLSYTDRRLQFREIVQSLANDHLNDRGGDVKWLSTP
ncbi:hypothetical protein PSE_3926 [Pseudovibrio sp. FO-BEG1]|nr:hypothetical protein PSE_3926 [Pseudovibrio sp. FO-BEG1]